MDGFVQFAQKLVKAVTLISPFPISLSDHNGYIIGDSNTARIGTLHKPSLEVLKADATLLFYKDDIKGTENAFPGVATPLRFDHRAVVVLGIIGDPKEVEPYAILVKGYVELMWQETFRNQIDDLESKALETFVQYILSTDHVTHESVEQYCKMFHIAFHQRRFCIVLDIGDSLLKSIKDGKKVIGLDPLKKALLNSARTLFQTSGNTICTFLNTEKIVLFMSVPSNDAFLQMMDAFNDRCEKLIQLFHNYGIHHLAIAAGSPYPTLHDMNQSFKEAEDLLKTGKKLHISPPIYHAYNWEVQLALLPTQIKSNFRERLLLRLKPLIEKDDFTELVSNFITYCTCDMNTSKAAKALYIHRNTLIYRLKKIEAITSINTGDFEQCMLLYLILKHYKNDN